jgi:glycyl-tRNA synthetase (class II)
LLAKGYYIPHVIEPSAGVDRLALALLCQAYDEDQAPNEKGELETRVVLRLHPRIAPVKVAVFPTAEKPTRFGGESPADPRPAPPLDERVLR